MPWIQNNERKIVKEGGISTEIQRLTLAELGLDAIDKRLLGTGNDEVDALLLRVLNDASVASLTAPWDGDVLAFAADEGSATVAGRDEDALDAAGLGELERKSVLTATRSEEEDGEVSLLGGERSELGHLGARGGVRGSREGRGGMEDEGHCRQLSEILKRMQNHNTWPPECHTGGVIQSEMLPSGQQQAWSVRLPAGHRSVSAPGTD